MAEHLNLWFPFFTLLAYVVVCRFVLVARLVQAQVPVPWFTLTVPLHMFQRCRDYQANVGPKPQWWALSADVAVLACIGLFVVIEIQRS